MASQDTEKLMAVTYSALKSEVGLLGDLPYDLANTVANIYFRYFHQAMDSAPPIGTEELLTRQREFESIRRFIAEFRLLPQKGTHQTLIAHSYAT